MPCPISALFDDMSWPREKLDGLVETVATLEGESSVAQLIRHCVQG